MAVQDAEPDPTASLEASGTDTQEPTVGRASCCFPAITHRAGSDAGCGLGEA